MLQAQFLPQPIFINGVTSAPLPLPLSFVNTGDGQEGTLLVDTENTGLELPDALRIYWKTFLGETRLYCVAPRAMRLAVNGIWTGQLRAQLRDGDYLSFGSSEGQRHCYQVSITTVPTAVATAPQAFAAADFKCPICLEIIYQATSLVLCGHCFCADCIEQDPNNGVCPCCRGQYSITMPNDLVDKAIAVLCHFQGFFSIEDRQTYFERDVANQTPMLGTTPNAAIPID